MTVVLSPIMDALYHGRADEAQRLVADASPDSLTIHEAAAAGVVPRLEQLLASDPATLNAWSPDGFQPLQVAALHAALAGPDHEIARLLVAAGADVNSRQQGGGTPLHEAAQNGEVELVRLLLEHGADPKATDDQHRTAADFAREQSHTEVVDFLAAFPHPPSG